MNFENKDDLRQVLLELHYDLLDESEASRLRAAIETDPDVATEWAATLRLAGKFDGAAKFEGGKSSKLNFVGASGFIHAKPSSNGSASSDIEPVITQLVETSSTLNIKAADDNKVSPADTWRWWIGSTGLAATAAAIGLVVIGSWYAGRVPEAPLAVVRMQAEPSSADRAQADNDFRIVTTRSGASESP